MNRVLLLPLLLLAMAASAQTENATVQFLNPPAVSKLKGLSEVVQVDLGTCRMLLISGQVPMDSLDNLVGKGDVTAQSEQVFRNLRSILEAQGGSMKDLVKIGIYLKDMAQAPAFREVRNKYINLANPPASTMVQVSKLFRDDVLLEVDATAILPKDR